MVHSSAVERKNRKKRKEILEEHGWIIVRAKKEPLEGQAYRQRTNTGEPVRSQVLRLCIEVACLFYVSSSSMADGRLGAVPEEPLAPAPPVGEASLSPASRLLSSSFCEQTDG